MHMRIDISGNSRTFITKLEILSYKIRDVDISSIKLDSKIRMIKSIILF